MDINEEERRNVTVLLRFISGFVAWPSLTIALAFLFIDAQEHMLHVAGLLPLGLAAVALFFVSPRIAAKFYPVEEIGSPA